MSEQSQHDFAVYLPNGSLALLVDAKTRKGTSTHWAAELRRNLIAHGALSLKTMFLLATPGAVYVWRSGLPADALASHEFVAGQLFRPYLEAAGFTPDAVNGDAFELIVGAWLRDVVHGSAERNAHLEGTGLPSLLKGGRVESEATQ